MWTVWKGLPRLCTQASPTHNMLSTKRFEKLRLECSDPLSHRGKWVSPLRKQMKWHLGVNLDLSTFPIRGCGQWFLFLENEDVVLEWLLRWCCLWLPLVPMAAALFHWDWNISLPRKWTPSLALSWVFHTRCNLEFALLGLNFFSLPLSQKKVCPPEHHLKALKNLAFPSLFSLVPHMCVGAKLLQLCPTLFDPMDHNPPGPSVHGILQEEYWSVLPFPPPGDLPNLGITPTSLAFLVLSGSLYHWATWVCLHLEKPNQFMDRKITCSPDVSSSQLDL